MEKLKQLFKALSPRFQTVNLEYKVNPKPRFGHGQPPHGQLLKIVEKNRKGYELVIQKILSHKKEIQSIKRRGEETNENEPVWNNDFLPGLDIAALFSLIREYKPKNYIEIGSGNSTLVSKKAIDHELDTKITSIDPYPRASIDSLADKVIRQPIEDLDNLSFIHDELEANDILFIDNSHRCLPNSDVTVCFLEILPKLKSGVIVHVHDIYIPFDYPQFMCDRFYSEQYMLASFLLANPEKYQVLFPNYFVSEDEALKEQLAPLWDHANMKGVERHGGSFWIKIT